jgi:rhamnogalacturonyl hydrolase YesR
MAPPFLAYFGVATRDIDLVQESVRQCECYAQVLGTEKGYWRHIANVEEEQGRKSDEGAWCTGNAWAVAGMARVLATLRKSRFAGETAKEQASLVGMVKGILDAAVGVDTHPSGLLRNYLDDESWFGEVAGTALMAAAAFRMAVLEPVSFGKEYTDWATAKLEAVARHIDPETGIATPVVNSLDEGQRTPLDGVNSEGQGFVVLCCAAWRDWKAASATDVQSGT